MDLKRETLPFLALAFLGVVWAKDATNCVTGNACFPYEPMPEDITPTSLSYYCCPQVNTTRRSEELPDKTLNCSCVEDLTLESKTRALAWSRAGSVRMCSREKDCEGLSSSSSLNDRFKYCCYSSDNPGNVDNTSTTIFDGDKEQFVLCRCLHLPLPTPDPKAYVVPPVLSYKSTEEACSYDEGCKDRPYAKCQSAGESPVTFCCYGSRGVVTQNDGNLTRCTCTQDVFGGQCEARPIAIVDSTASCLTQCSNRSEEDTCTDSNQTMRCCPHNMAVEALQSNGVFSSCICKANITKSCGNEAASHATHFSGHFINVLSLMFAAFVLGQMRCLLLLF